MNETLLDKFGEIVDEFLKKNEIIMQIRMPENEDCIEIKDNTGGGPTIQLYIVMKALPAILNELTRTVGELDVEGFLDSIWELIKEETLELRGLQQKEATE